MSQAAVSYAIRGLEEQLGVPLFVREHRRVRLSEAGERFFTDVTLGLNHIRKSAEELREIGADEAYRRLLLSGVRPHFIGYYVLHMGLQGRPWNDCKGEEKKALRVRFDALKAEVARRDDGVPPGIEQFLDQIGVGQKR